MDNDGILYDIKKYIEWTEEIDLNKVINKEKCEKNFLNGSINILICKGFSCDC